MLILMGGVQINMPSPMADYFQPLLFEVRVEGEPVIDLMPSIFGKQQQQQHDCNSEEQHVAQSIKSNKEKDNRV